MYALASARATSPDGNLSAAGYSHPAVRPVGTGVLPAGYMYPVALALPGGAPHIKLAEFPLAHPNLPVAREPIHDHNMTALTYPATATVHGVIKNLL
jgi:hypothetical protein